MCKYIYAQQVCVNSTGACVLNQYMCTLPLRNVYCVLSCIRLFCRFEYRWRHGQQSAGNTGQGRATRWRCGGGRLAQGQIYTNTVQYILLFIRQTLSLVFKCNILYLYMYSVLLCVSYIPSHYCTFLCLSARRNCLVCVMTCAYSASVRAAWL